MMPLMLPPPLIDLRCRHSRLFFVIDAATCYFMLRAIAR